MRKGDRINLPNGNKAIITKIGMGDFIGDPFTINYQYLDKTHKVVRGWITSDRLKPTGAGEYEK